MEGFKKKIFMKNIPLLVGTLIVTLALVVGVALFFSQSSQSAEQVHVSDQKLLLGDSRHVKGPADAKVTLVEFSDFQCPSCLAVEPLVRQITAKYPNDVRLVYRQFPLVQIHHNALQAATFAEATTKFNKFWEAHDLLFDNQSDWADVTDQSQLQKIFDGYLAKLQIDKTQFQKTIESQETQNAVTSDVSDATKLNLQGTPTFFVNGQMTLAPQLVSTVESIVTGSQKK